MLFLSLPPVSGFFLSSDLAGAKAAVSETVQESTPSWARGVDKPSSPSIAAEPVPVGQEMDDPDVPAWARGAK